MRNTRVCVRMRLLRSREVTLKQGVGQGRIPSTEEYKLHLNDLLCTLESSSLGAHIGPFFVGSPTCADDVMLLADSPEDLQAQLSIVSAYSRRERYVINPTKTTITVYPGNNIKSNSNKISTWKLGSTEIHPTDSFTHLGISRKSGKLSPDELVSQRIQLAQRTCYALMGAGLHGTNGLSPVIAWRMYLTYVVPRLLYNLEVIKLTATQVTRIEQFHRSTLRAIQGLPVRTSSAITYLLLGALPIEATLHIRTLHLLGRIATNKDSILAQIGYRQLSLKDTDSNSWYIYCVKIAGKYGLPQIHDVFDGTVSPSRWRHLVKKTIQDHWEKALLSDAATKSTLAHIHISALTMNHPHPVWHYVAPNMRDTSRARIKSRLLTGTYTLQSSRAKFNKNSVDPTCPLCHTGTEDVTHMLVMCSALQDTRLRLLPNLLELVIDTTAREELVRNPVALTFAILDSNYSLAEGIIIRDQLEQWEFNSRILCYYLHVNHTKLLMATAEALPRRKAAPI